MHITELKDRLLVAIFSEVSKTDLSEYVDPSSVARKFNLPYQTGAIGVIVGEFEKIGIAETSGTIGNGPDEGWNLRLTFAGITEAQKLIDGHPDYEHPGNFHIPTQDEGSIIDQIVADRPGNDLGPGLLGNGILGNPATRSQIPVDDSAKFWDSNSYLSVSEHQTEFDRLQNALTKLRLALKQQQEKEPKNNALNSQELFQLHSEINAALAQISAGQVRKKQISEGLTPALQGSLMIVAAYPGISKMIYDTMLLIKTLIVQ